MGRFRLPHVIQTDRRVPRGASQKGGSWETMRTTEKQNGAAPERKGKLMQKLHNENSVLILLIAVSMLIFSFVVPNFLTAGNLFNLLIQASNIGIPAIGLTFIIITAGIDLSLPTNMACSAILGCSIMAKTQSVFLGILSIMLIATFFGMVNGFSVSKLKMVPMIVTLAIQTLNVGISEYYTQGTSIGGMPESFTRIFAGNLFGVVPVSVVVFLALAVVMHLLLSKTIFGRQLFQTGINEKAAQVNGVNTTRIIFLIYLIGGVMAGINGVLTAARLTAAGPSMGPASAFNNIVCACVLGGASVWGGKGTIFGTVLGSIVMVIITNVMNLLNVNFFTTFVIKGIIIILVCYIDILRNKAKVKER